MQIYPFEDIFEVKQIDPDGKKFDRVSRIKAKGENYESEILLDVNFDLFPLKLREKFSFILTPSISLDGSAEEGVYDQSGKETMADNYDYVMFGKIYKIEDCAGNRLAAYISFGGLLLRLECETKHLKEINVGNDLYLLMKRI